MPLPGGWILAAGTSSVLAVVLSLNLIRQHIRSFSQPEFQLYVCRIILMVPLFTCQSFFSFLFPSSSTCLNTLRDCYEAYVLYTFLKLLINYLGGEELILFNFGHSTRLSHPFPFKYIFRPLHLGRRFLKCAKRCVMQFVLIRPLTAFWTLSTDLLPLSGAMTAAVGPHNLVFSSHSLAIFAINSFSVGLAMYALVLFYLANSRALIPFKPIPKFLCVKIIVFFSFWQTHLISVWFALIGVSPKLKPLAGVWKHLADASPNYAALSEIQRRTLVLRLNDFLTCLEMLVIAVCLAFAFNPREHMYLPISGSFVGDRTDVLDTEDKPLIVAKINKIFNVKDLVEEAHSVFWVDQNKAQKEFPLHEVPSYSSKVKVGKRQQKEDSKWQSDT